MFKNKTSSHTYVKQGQEIAATPQDRQYPQASNNLFYKDRCSYK